MERQRLERLRDALRASCPDLELREREPMSRHTTFRIGGPARLMALPRTAEEARTALRTAMSWTRSPFSWATAPTCWCPTRGMRASW